MNTMRIKKNRRQRGSHTHGYGSKKKHRGAGNRGGRGMAGTGKRGDAKKPSIWKQKKYFGKHGFKKKNIKAKINAINITAIEQNLAGWVNKKLAEEKNGVFEINLQKSGYNKVLSTGKATKKMNITSPYASAGAVEKIKSAGGSISGLVKEASKEPKIKQSSTSKNLAKAEEKEENN